MYLFFLDINVLDLVGKILLYNVIFGKYFNIVDLLLKLGVDVKCFDEWGDMFLYVVVRVDSEVIVVVRKYNVCFCYNDIFLFFIW